MLSTVQIILICLIGVLAVLSVVFMVMFLVELARQNKQEDETTVKVESVFTVNEQNSSSEEKVSVSDMLAKLDKLTASSEEQSEEISEEQKEETETVEENKEETAVVEDKAEESSTEAEAVAENAGEAEGAETVVVEDKAEETAAETEVVEAEVNEEPKTEQNVTNIFIVNGNEEVSELPSNASLIDYQNRLEKIIQTRDKISRDLEKLQKSILKYERTKRRKDRNQRMLDRRAGELTNLNLLMYSVTDIKNVDEEKKLKQEDLTAHIAELKASIQDADEYIESNKEKNLHDVKMAKFLQSEEARYNEEIAELEKLISATTDAAQN